MHEGSRIEQTWLTRWVLGLLKSLFQHPLVGTSLLIFYATLFLLGVGLCIYLGPVLQTYGTLYTCGMVFLVSGMMLLLYQTIVNTASSEWEIHLKTQENTKKTAENLVLAQNNLTEMTTQNNSLKESVKKISTENTRQKELNRKLKNVIDGLNTMVATLQKTLTTSIESNNEATVELTKSTKELQQENEQFQKNNEEMRQLVKKMSLTLSDKSLLEQLKETAEISEKQDQDRNPLIEKIKVILSKLQNQQQTSNPLTATDDDWKIIIQSLEMICTHNEEYDNAMKQD